MDRIRQNMLRGAGKFQVELALMAHSVAMSSQQKNAANRNNAQKSTGPRSEKGKAKSRWNALQSGIHAKSQVIPGEKVEELEAIATEYREHFQPDTPETVVLTDALIGADWRLRRLRRIEAELWNKGMDANNPDLSGAYSQNPLLDQVMRRIQTTERSHRATLRQIMQIQKDERERREKEAYEQRMTAAYQRAVEQARAEHRAAMKARRKLGSFLSEEEAGADAPAVEKDPLK